MKVAVVIRKNETMELIISKKRFKNDYTLSALKFIYMEGNYSCDCNLETDFDPESDRDVPCYAEPGKELYTIMAIYADGLPVFVRTAELKDEDIKETIVSRG